MYQSSSRLRYRAYGLIFECDFALPELHSVPHDPSPPDVLIEVGSPLASHIVEKIQAPEATIEDILSFESEKSSVLFNSVGRFTVSHGSHILVEPIEGRGPSTWRLPLLGSILALLLEQRGLFVLHAGAVEIGGGAVAFLGDKGQGKSTLNAALSIAGYPLFSDDAVALTWSDPNRPTSADKLDCPMALCGFAQIKLVPDAARAVLSGDPDDWPAVAPELSEVDKRSFMAPLAQHSLPLRHLFILNSMEEGESNEGVIVRPLSPQEALIQLIPHTFAARFGDLYLTGARRKAHFMACTRVVRECNVWELSRRRDLALLPSTIEHIARTVGTLSTRASAPASQLASSHS